MDFFENINLNEIINESIHRILSENENVNIDVIEIDDKEIMKTYIVEIWDIMKLSYKDKGGFQTAQSPNHLLKNTDLIKLVQLEDTVIACATYRIFGGFKMTAIGCNQTNEGKIGLQKIIQDDIKNFKGWYWAEVSEAVEHYFKKYNGYPIPNIYVSELLKRPVILLDDDLHYTRAVGVDAIPYTKAIYGFKDESVFNKVMAEIDNYDTFRERVNNIKEDKDDYAFQVNKAITIIENIYNYHIEDRFNEMTPFWNKSIKWAIATLQQTPKKDKTIKRFIQTGLDLIEEMPLLKINKF